MSLFQSQLAIVFGGGRDIGRAISIKLARSGAQVAFSYHGSNADETLSVIKQTSVTAWSRRVDALNTAEVREFAKWASQQAAAPIDILVNVVGGLVARKRMEEMDDAFWDLAMTQAALPLMNDGGTIINVSSLAAREGGGGGSIAYATSKGALVTFTRGLAKELGARRIRVNAVCPGMISTKFHDDFTLPEIRQKVAAATPLGREGKAEEVAELVAFLASAKPSYINGACIDINGGGYFS
jgi:3-oxoacyl-[acyl-carrier protein] reductase